MATLSTRTIHPTRIYELSNGGDNTAVVKLVAGYRPDLNPADPVSSPPHNHPTPNAFTINLHEGDDGATEAEITLDPVALEQLRDALTDALAWDGQ